MINVAPPQQPVENKEDSLSDIIKKSNYYELLGINASANTREIRKAYHKLAKRYHPDHYPHNPEITDYFTKLSEAYEVLSNPARREEYHKQHEIKTYTPTLERSELKNFFSLREFFSLDTYMINWLVTIGVALYAIIVLCGGVPRFSFVCMTAIFCILAACLYWEEIDNCVAELTPKQLNLVCLIVFIETLSHSYMITYMRIFSESPVMYHQADIVVGAMRFLIFCWWILFGSDCHWFVLCFLLAIAPRVKKYRLFTAWSILALQIVATLVIRYDSNALVGFVTFYQPLFDILPLKPSP